VLPRRADGSYPDAVWFAEGAGGVLLADPILTSADRLTVHLISKRRYRQSELLLWDPSSGATRAVAWPAMRHPRGEPPAQ
jgi:hypothetical protein